MTLIGSANIHLLMWILEKGGWGAGEEEEKEKGKKNLAMRTVEIYFLSDVSVYHTKATFIIFKIEQYTKCYHLSE